MIDLPRVIKYSLNFLRHSNSDLLKSPQGDRPTLWHASVTPRYEHATQTLSLRSGLVLRAPGAIARVSLGCVCKAEFLQKFYYEFP